MTLLSLSVSLFLFFIVHVVSFCSKKKKEEQISHPQSGEKKYPTAVRRLSQLTPKMLVFFNTVIGYSFFFSLLFGGYHKSIGNYDDVIGAKKKPMKMRYPRLETVCYLSIISGRSGGWPSRAFDYFQWFFGKELEQYRRADAEREETRQQHTTKNQKKKNKNKGGKFHCVIITIVRLVSGGQKANHWVLDEKNTTAVTCERSGFSLFLRFFF